MSKRINNSKIVACMLALGFMAVGSGCTDSDFDLSSIDSTIGLGGKVCSFLPAVQKTCFSTMCSI